MKNRINITVFVLAAAVFVTATACQKAESTNTNSNSNKAANSAAAATATQAPPIMTPEGASTQSTTADSPTAAYKAAYAARKNKDIAALKKLMSKEILAFFTEMGGFGEKPQTLDEILMELCNEPQASTDESRNEKINGNKATIEFLNAKGAWSTMEFLKEDGAWKLTIEKPEKGDIEIETSPKGKIKK